MNYKETAMKLFSEGYNCAQAVLMAFASEAGIDEKQAALIASSFGGGIGRMRHICGAVSGSYMAAGLIFGYSDPNDRDAKTKHYALIQEMAQKFKDKNGSIICRELLGDPDSSPVSSERNNEFYKKRPCAMLVGDAAEILESYLKESR